MKRLIFVLAAVLFVSFTLSGVAQEKAAVEKPGAGKTMKEAPALEEVTVTGKITTNAMGRFIVTTAEGAVTVLPPVRKVEGAEAIDLQKYVGKDVTVVGKGHVMKGDKPKTMLRMITSVTEAAAKTEAPKPPEAPKTEAK